MDTNVAVGQIGELRLKSWTRDLDTSMVPTWPHIPLKMHNAHHTWQPVFATNLADVCFGANSVRRIFRTVDRADNEPVASNQLVGKAELTRLVVEVNRLHFWTVRASETDCYSSATRGDS